MKAKTQMFGKTKVEVELVNFNKPIVTFNDSLVMVISNQTEFGMAIKNDEDVFNKEIGKALAFLRYQTGKGVGMNV